MMDDMSDEFDTTEAEIDEMIAVGEPVALSGPDSLPFGIFVSPGSLTHTAATSMSSTQPVSGARSAVTAAA